MGLKLVSLITLLVAAFCLAEAKRITVSKHEVVCYDGTWAYYRPGNGKFDFSNIDPFLCTTVIYTFAMLQNNRIASFDPYLDLPDNWGLNGYGKMVALKQQNPNLKVTLAIGGWNECDTPKYSDMASSPSTRKIFVDSVVPFLQRYGFDGLDMDWEYPVTRNGKPEDRENFVLLLEELRAVLEPQGLLLTAAVAAGKDTIDQAYDVPRIVPSLDAIHLMTYDFHGAWETVTGINAPLYPRPNATEQDKELTVDYAVKYWIEKGAPKEKLIMGVGFYGRSFTLADTSQNGVGAPAVGDGGQPGPWTRQPGTLGYNEICLKIVQEGWAETWDDVQKVPYAYKGNQWVGYDNVKSIDIKVDYLLEQGLGGALTWSIDTDDFRGSCYGQQWPLLRTIADKLINSENRL